MNKPLIISTVGGNSQYSAFVRFKEFYLKGFEQLGCEIRYLTSQLRLSSQEVENGFLFYFAYFDNDTLWDIYRSAPILPIVNHLIDHPLDCFFPPQDTLGFTPAYFPVTFDPTWVEFISRNTDEKPPIGIAFLPLAGFIHPEVTKFTPVFQREIKLLFAGSTAYNNPFTVNCRPIKLFTIFSVSSWVIPAFLN